MVLFGYDIGPGKLVRSPGFPLPLALGGTSIKVTVNGAALDMPIVYTSSSQVAALLPSSTPTGDGTPILKAGRAARRREHEGVHVPRCPPASEPLLGTGPEHRVYRGFE
jgi:uncharacterized protein (TIGR03437 family)